MHGFKVALVITAVSVAVGCVTKAQLSQTGMGKVAGGGGVACGVGAIDLSAGCVLPMMGGL